MAPLPEVLHRHPVIRSWLRVEADNTVTVLTGKVELGQGIRTALMQIVAEELLLLPEQIRMQEPTTGISPDEGYTVGSASIEQSGTALRLAAAELREGLLDAAADSRGLAARKIRLVHGNILDAEDNRLSRMADLYPLLPPDLCVTGTVPPYGAAVPQAARLDIPAKVMGKPEFVHDLFPPGGLHARVLLPPAYGARLQALDSALAESAPGVRRVLRDGSFVAVVCEREDQAVRALSRLEAGADWNRAVLRGGEDVYSYLRSLPKQEYLVKDATGSGGNAPPSNVRVAATYTKPYQAHGSMAPSCAVAQDDGEVLTVWTHSQGIYPLRRELAVLTDLAEERIRVIHCDGPGCYGHNGADDVAADAALIAREMPGQPIRVQWTLEQELSWEPFGSAMIVDLEADLSTEGRILRRELRVVTDIHNARPNGNGDRLVASWHLSKATSLAWPGPMENGYRNAETLYAIEEERITAHFCRGPLRVSALRTLGSFGNTFANESFMDESAYAAGVDPVAFRLGHLADERARAVIEAATSAAGYRPHESPSGQGIGMAMARYKNSKAYVAQVVFASVDSRSGRIRVERVVVACDAGRIVSPDGLRNQLEGGTLQGISRTLLEAVRFDEAGVRSVDWEQYPVLKFADVPEVECVLLDRPDQPSLGAGEAATVPVAAAIANAVFDASGIRLRELPFTPDAVRRRLLTMSDQELESVIIEG